MVFCGATSTDYLRQEYGECLNGSYYITPNPTKHIPKQLKDKLNELFLQNWKDKMNKNVLTQYALIR